MRNSAAFLQTNFWLRWILYLEAFAQSSTVSMRRRSKSLAPCRLSGQRNLGSRLAFQFRSAPSMPTGTRLARAAAPMTWSTSSEHLLALLESPHHQIWCLVFVEWCKEAFILSAQESKPVSPQSAIFSML